MAKLIGGWEREGESLRVFAVIPPRRNGGVNEGALSAALLALTQINPDAFDPDPPPKPEAAGIIPHGVAQAAMRDSVVTDPEREDDTGEPYPDPRYAGASCNIGGRCDD